jgi:hypothetical protein
MRSDKQATPFLFASPDRRAAAPSSSSARRVHLRRLCDILHLSIQRGDLPLARNAFGLLARCEDVEWPDIWKFGLVLLATADGDAPPSGDADADVVVGTPKHIEFLQVMMLRYPEQVRTYFFFTLGRRPFANSPSIYPSTPLYYSAKRSCGSWYCHWQWLDGSAMPSMNLSCADPPVFSFFLSPFLHTQHQHQ